MDTEAVKDERDARASREQDPLRASVERTARPRPGRPRKPRERVKGMGRRPFMACANKYLHESGHLSKSTYDEYERKLRYLSGVFEMLYKQGKVKTRNPMHMTEDDIRAFLSWMDVEKHLDNDTRTKYIGILKQLLLSFDNYAIQRMENKKQLPRRVRKEVKVLTEGEVWRIVKAAKNIEGWRGVVATFLSVIYPFTGLRPSELRRARRIDLDTTSWEMFVAHPKGEGKYGVKRTVPVLPPARPYVLEYLKQRSEHLAKYGIPENQCDQLIPRIVRGRKETAYYTLTALHVLKYEIEAIAGISFKLKTFRATYGQMNLDRGAKLDRVSRLMGHSNTATTERFYCRVKDRAAFEEINEIWEEKIGSGTEKAEIRNKTAPPIYQ